MKKLYTLLSTFCNILLRSDKDSADTTFDSSCGASPTLAKQLIYPEATGSRSLNFGLTLAIEA